jgi:hypothetical protein
MKDVPENDLFSAYLDGELAAEEQVRVERLVAANPAARKLMDEFRALSTALRSLPERKLDQDLTQLVLLQAEAQMVSDAAADESPVAAATSVAEESRLNTFRRLLRPRSLAWSGLAAAAGLMIWAAVRVAVDRPDGEIVALRPEAVEGSAADKSRDLASTGAAPAPSAEADEYAFISEVDKASLADESKAEAGEGVEVGGGIDGLRRMLPRSPTRGRAVDQPAAESAEFGVAAKPPKADASIEVVAEEAELSDLSLQPEAPSAGLAYGMPGRPSMPAISPGQAGMSKGAELLEAEEGQRVVLPKVASEGPADLLAGKFATAAESGTFAWYCRQTAQAKREGIFDRILAKQQIRPEKALQTPVRTAETKENVRAPYLGQQPSERAAGTENVRFVAVEATKAQIEAVVGELASRPDFTVTRIDLGGREDGDGLQKRFQATTARGVMSQAVELYLSRARVEERVSEGRDYKEGALEGASERPAPAPAPKARGEIRPEKERHLHEVARDGQRGGAAEPYVARFVLEVAGTATPLAADANVNEPSDAVRMAEPAGAAAAAEAAPAEPVPAERP